MPNEEFRLALHTTELERIPIIQQGESYTIQVNADQLERIRQNTRSRYAYVVQPSQVTTADPGGFRASRSSWSQYFLEEHQ